MYHMLSLEKGIPHGYAIVFTVYYDTCKWNQVYVYIQYYISSEQTPGIELMLYQWRSTIYDAGPT